MLYINDHYFVNVHGSVFYLFYLITYFNVCMFIEIIFILHPNQVICRVWSLRLFYRFNPYGLPICCMPKNCNKLWQFPKSLTKSATTCY